MAYNLGQIIISQKNGHKTSDGYSYQMLFYLNLSTVTDESAFVKDVSNGVNAVLMTPLMGYENGKPSDGVDLDPLLRLDRDNNVIAIRFKTGKNMTGDELKPIVRMLYDEMRTGIAKTDAFVKAVESMSDETNEISL